MQKECTKSLNLFLGYQQEQYKIIVAILQILLDSTKTGIEIPQCTSIFKTKGCLEVHKSFL